MSNNVKVGQVWQDNDPRMQMIVPIRTIVVLRVDDTHAICKNCYSGKITKIRLSRFRANSTGYRLLDPLNGVNADHYLRALESLIEAAEPGAFSALFGQVIQEILAIRE